MCQFQETNRTNPCTEQDNPQPLSTDRDMAAIGMCEIAMAYLGLGLSVIPLEPISRDSNGDYVEQPAVPDITLYRTRRPTPEELYRWFVEERHQNMAVLTGAVNGVVVLECSTHDDYLWVMDHGVPPTPTCQTGYCTHVFFRHSCDLELVAGCTAQPGIDVKSNGAFVACPPTCYPGGSCDWLVSPGRAAIATMPAELATALGQERVRKARARFDRQLDKLRNDRNNARESLLDYSFKAAKLLSHFLTRNEVHARLVEVGVALGLDIDDARAFVEFGLGNGIAQIPERKRRWRHWYSLNVSVTAGTVAQIEDDFDNSAEIFVEACCQRGRTPEHVMPLSEMLASYREYCRGSGYTALHGDEFLQQFRYLRLVPSAPGTTPSWSGIRLRPAAPPTNTP